MLTPHPSVAPSNEAAGLWGFVNPDPSLACAAKRRDLGNLASMPPRRLRLCDGGLGGSCSVGLPGRFRETRVSEELTRFPAESRWQMGRASPDPVSSIWSLCGAAYQVPGCVLHHVHLSGILRGWAGRKLPAEGLVDLNSEDLTSCDLPRKMTTNNDQTAEGLARDVL